MPATTKNPSTHTGRAPGHHRDDGADGRAGDDDADPEAALQGAPLSRPPLAARPGRVLPPAGVARSARAQRCATPRPLSCRRGCVTAAWVPVGCVMAALSPWDASGRLCSRRLRAGGPVPPRAGRASGGSARRLPDRRRAWPGGLDPTRYRPHLARRSRGRPSRDHVPGDLTRARRPARLPGPLAPSLRPGSRRGVRAPRRRPRGARRGPGIAAARPGSRLTAVRPARACFAP